VRPQKCETLGPKEGPKKEATIGGAQNPLGEPQRKKSGAFKTPEAKIPLWEKPLDPKGGKSGPKSPKIPGFCPCALFRVSPLERWKIRRGLKSEDLPPLPPVNIPGTLNEGLRGYSRRLTLINRELPKGEVEEMRTLTC